MQVLRKLEPTKEIETKRIHFSPLLVYIDMHQRGLESGVRQSL